MTDNSKKLKSEYVPRTLQLDAGSFDDEIKTLLQNQLSEVNQYLTPGTLDSFKSEINLILDLLIFKYSLVNRNSTFGQDIFNLKYKNKFSSMKLTVFALMNFIFPYIINKVEDKSGKLGYKMLEKTARRIYVFFQACTVINLMVFLREGKYPTVVDRLLQLKYVPAKPINTHVGYNFMIKELLLQGIMMFLTNVLPFVNVKKIKIKIKRFFQKKSNKFLKENQIVFNTRTKCVVCNEFPTVPSQISVYCPHVACYYCLKSNTLADDKFSCPVCGESYSGFEDVDSTLLEWVSQQLCIKMH